MRNLRQILATFAVAVLWAACTDEPVAGGSGSEAGNALKVAALAPDGTPVAGARIEIRASNSESTNSTFSDTTGSDGSATLSVPDGSWSILVRKGGLSYWTISDGSKTVRDTLRPDSRLSGILHGGAGGRIAVVGLGMDATCESSGFFQLENLPSGQLPLAFHETRNNRLSSVKLVPGTNVLALTKSDSIPSQISSLPSDSLIPWSTRQLPAMLPHAALGDSGSFSVAVRLRRTDTTTAMWAISWTDNGSKGIRIGWRGADTFLMNLDGKDYSVAGIPLTGNVEQIGLSWDGHRISVLLDRDSVVNLTSSTFDRRSSWNTPEFGSTGTAKVEWVAFKRGRLVEDWLRRLSNM